MNIKYLLVGLIMWGTIIALGGPPRPPVKPVTADPNDPEKNRSIISREEREKLGLTPHTWAGVADSEVYTRIDKLNKTVASLKDKLNKEMDTQTFDLLHRYRARFEGTVYVQVQVKPDPNIKDSHRRVLASLKASEFHAPYLFEKSAGFVGYTTKEGLDKLSTNTNVIGVCLDDKPLPEKCKTIYKNDLPAAKPEESANEPGVAEGKVDPDIYRAFAVSNRVDVAVSLRSDSLPNLTDVPSEMWARNELRKQAEKQIQDRVLSTVSADDFWLWSRLGSGVSGIINREGVEKLWKHPDVIRICGLEEEHTAARIRNR